MNLNGADITHRVPPPPDLTYDERVLALYVLRAVVRDDPVFRVVVAKLNHLQATVPLSVLYGVAEYAARVCPYMRADAVDKAIRAELDTIHAQEG